MKALRIFFGILFFLTNLVACGKRLPKEVDPPAKASFGIAVPDSQVKILDSYSALKSTLGSQQNKGSVTDVSSRAWLELANQFMETGTALDQPFRDKLLQAGHKLSQTFYGFNASHTSMTGSSRPAGNPWGEAAYQYAKPVMTTQLSQALVNVEEKVTVAASHVQVMTADLGTQPRPEDLLQRVIDGLQSFEAELSSMRDGTGDSIVDQINSTVNTKYVKDLNTLRDSARMDRSRPLVDSLKGLAAILGQMAEISDLDRQRLLLRVNEGIGLATRNDALKDSTGALNLLLDIWMSSDTRPAVPQSVKNIFQHLTDNEILSLATANQGKIFTDDQWNQFKNRTDYSLVPDRQMVALFLNNNGYVISPDDWNKISQNSLPGLLAAMKTPEVQNFINMYAEDYPVDANDGIFVLVSTWLNLSYRISYPLELKKAFLGLNDAALTLLKAGTGFLNGTTSLLFSANLNLAKDHYGMLSGIESFGAQPGQKISAKQGIQNFKDFFTGQVVDATRQRLDNAVTPIAQNLSEQLQNNIIPQLEDQKKNMAATIDGSYRIYSRYYLGKLIFGADLVKGSMSADNESADNQILAQHPLPLLEKSSLRLVNKSGHYQDEGTDDVTSASVLGLGLQNMLARLVSSSSLQTYENISPSARGASALEFQIIGKLLTLSGYRDANNQLTDSLAVAVLPGHASDKLDIRNYDPTVEAFATPDVMHVLNQFRLDPASAQNPKFSVNGQMDLLRAYSLLLGYFKPWNNPSNFDLGLGGLRIEEEPELKAFDRDDYFLLTLGLASIVLKNISVKMLGLITSDHQFLDPSQFTDPEKVDARGAVLGDFSLTGMNHVIQTSAMARGILALSEFYEAISDLEKTTNPTIIEAFKQNPLDEVRSNLQKLISGLVIFSTGKLMAVDGGFAPSYDGTSNAVSEKPRQLGDQLLMEKALLEAGRVMNSDFFKSQAVDNLFFLNTHFWNPQLGFYGEVENSQEGKVRLGDVALALQNIKVIEKILPSFMTQSPNLKDSLTQMGRFEDTWEKRFFAPLLDQPAVTQIFEFSL